METPRNKPFITSLDELTAGTPEGKKYNVPLLRKHLLAKLNSYFEQQDTVYLVNTVMAMQGKGVDNEG